MSGNILSTRHPLITLLTRSLAVGLGLYICSLPSLALAKPKFNAPAGRGLPGRREPAGTRGQCLNSKLVSNPPAQPAYPQDFKTLAALAPAADKSMGFTVSEYPSFFWYLPEFKPGYANMLEFSLNQYGAPPRTKPLYKATFKVKSNQAGVMSLSLPKNSGLPPLEIGKTYRWSITVICDPDDRAGEDVAEGYIERIAISPELKGKLSKAKSAEIPEVYAQAGIWYDSIATLAEMRRTKPDKTSTNLWAEMMEAINFQKLSQEPFSECCRPETTQGMNPQN